jgi:transcriptional regulator with XRE-family HTH domain
MTTVAERLKELRGRAGLPRKELARLAGLSVSLIGHIERGIRRQPKANTLTELARVFGAEFDYLFSGAGQPPSDRTLRRSVDSARAQKAEAA